MAKDSVKLICTGCGYETWRRPNKMPKDVTTWVCRGCHKKIKKGGTPRLFPRPK